MQFLEEDPELLDKIEALVRAQLNGLNIEVEGVVAEAKADDGTSEDIG